LRFFNLKVKQTRKKTAQLFGALFQIRKKPAELSGTLFQTRKEAPELSGTKAQPDILIVS
jgi:hypothetical protein